MSEWDLELLAQSLQEHLSAAKQETVANGLLCPLLNVRSGRVEVRNSMTSPDDTFLKALFLLWREHQASPSGRHVYEVLQKINIAPENLRACQGLLQVRMISVMFFLGHFVNCLFAGLSGRLNSLHLRLRISEKLEQIINETIQQVKY